MTLGEPSWKGLGVGEPSLAFASLGLNLPGGFASPGGKRHVGFAKGSQISRACANIRRFRESSWSFFPLAPNLAATSV